MTVVIENLPEHPTVCGVLARRNFPLSGEGAA